MTVNAAGAVEVVASGQPGRVALRPLAIPNEHGAWALLLEPIVLGFAIAPSGAGACLALAVMSAFFLRHPLRLASRDVSLGKRYPRTSVCVYLAMAYASVTITAFAAAISMASLMVVLPFALASPFFLLQFYYDVRNRGRELKAEICGAVAASAGGAACILAGGGSVTMAVVVSVLAISRSVPAILYVRSLLRRSGFITQSLAHLSGVTAVTALTAVALAPVTVVCVPLLLLIRSLGAPLRTGIRARRIGVEEVVWGAVCTTVLALVLRQASI